MPNTVANDWDETSPALNQPRRDGAAEILSLRAGINARLSREHEPMATAGEGGEHLEGSAKIYYDATEPTLRPDGTTALGADDAGRLWYDPDNGRIKIWDGNSWEFQSEVTQDNFTAANGSPYTLPFASSSISSGYYLVMVYGAAQLNTSGAYTASLTLGGTSKSIDIPANLIATNIPHLFCMPFTLFHAGGTLSVTAATNCNIQGMVGVRIT